MYALLVKDEKAISIEQEFGDLSDQYINRANELQKLHNIEEPRRNVWVKDSPTGKLYLKLLNRFEHYQHYQSANYKSQ